MLEGGRGSSCEREAERSSSGGRVDTQEVGLKVSAATAGGSGTKVAVGGERLGRSGRRRFHSGRKKVQIQGEVNLAWGGVYQRENKADPYTLVRS